MRKHVWIVGLFMVLCLATLVPALANAAEPDQKALTDLLNNLDQKINDADQRRVAHPKFLEELRALVKEYRAKIRVVFLSEDFSDGDYSRNPVWVVDSGTFRVTKDRRLLSEAVAETPTATPAPQRKRVLWPGFSRIF
jgi:riboflavin biosynthesis pyrimidine reductase